MAGTLDSELYYARDAGKALLQLHDEHTLWKVDNDAVLEDGGDTYGLIVRDLCEAFEGETGVPVGCWGRMGRHVCVEDTPMNRLNFHRLRKLALEFEKECVRVCNEWKPLEGEDE